MSNDRFIRIHACDPKQPGRRLRLDREDGELAQLVEETTLPERVLSENAQRVERHEMMWLTAIEARWLHDALGELLPGWEQNANDQALLDARSAERVECGSCDGWGHFSKYGKPSSDKRDRKCLDCGGEGKVPA